ncbi:MAG: hypothetical protein U0350_17950 [Caldilineaceae bacterium]
MPKFFTILLAIVILFGKLLVPQSLLAQENGSETTPTSLQPSFFATDLAPSCDLFMENGESRLYRINATTGAPTALGLMGISSVTDIAMGTNKLYAITFSKFLTYDFSTGTSTIIGNVNHFVNALATRNGVIYAAGVGDLLKISPTTGQGTVIGSFGPGLSSAGDLAFDPSGNLYASLMRAGSSNNWLARVNPNTGSATLIGDIGSTLVDGLSFRGDILYGVTETGRVLRINVNTGASSLIGTNGIAQFGLTSTNLPGCQTAS